MNDIERIDSMIAILREMKKDKQRMQKLSAVSYTDLTPKQAQKRRYDADWIGMEQIKRQHKLHALAVELDIADRRPHYDQIELTDGWHRYNFKPPEPHA